MLSKLIFTMILQLAPHVGDSRAAQLAADISAVTDNIEDAQVLIAVIRHESDFRKAVEVCDEIGDNGTAFGLTQLHKKHWGRYTEKQVCSSRKLQFYITLHSLGKGTPEERFRRFMGRWDPKDKKIADRLETVSKLNDIINKGN